MSYFILSIFFGVTIGIAVSVDAFMLSLVYGSTFVRRREAYITSFFVGLFHFFMPFLGFILATAIFKQTNLITLLEDKLKYFTFAILMILGVMMIIKDTESQPSNLPNLFNKLFFAFSVSLDSFLIGIAFTTFDEVNIFIVAILFSSISALVTFFALFIGKRTANKFINKDLNFYAGILLLLLASLTLFF
jgi:manganese efflux pump family protein